jgi:hypothetical protein
MRCNFDQSSPESLKASYLRPFARLRALSASSASDTNLFRACSWLRLSVFPQDTSIGLPSLGVTRCRLLQTRAKLMCNYNQCKLCHMIKDRSGPVLDRSWWSSTPRTEDQTVGPVLKILRPQTGPTADQTEDRSKDRSGTGPMHP